MAMNVGLVFKQTFDAIENVGRKVVSVFLSIVSTCRRSQAPLIWHNAFLTEATILMP